MRPAFWLVLLGYVAVVIYTAAHHEMWRDEVRALSLATEGSLSDLFAELHFEGHPALWFLLLRAAHALTGSRLVLPALSLAAAVASIYLLLRYAPFAWPQKILIVLGVFPLFEYSVMARNYGLGMLVVFLLAMAHPGRFERPVRYGILLAVLANTSAHAAIVALALFAGWGAEFVIRHREVITLAGHRRAWRIWLGALIAVAGATTAVVTATGGHALETHDVAANPHGVPHQMIAAALWSNQALVGLLPSPATPMGNDSSQVVRTKGRIIAVDLLLLALIIGLWGRWPLLITGLAATAGTSVLFRLVYSGSMRHIGILWALFLLLYWEALRDPDPGPRSPSGRRRVFWALTVPLTVVMLLQAVEGIRRVRQDLTSNMSSSAAMGALLQRPEYRDATVMATSDYLLEALPYYGARRLYFHSQRRFETHVHYNLPFAGDRSFLGVFAVADSVAATNPAPILILIPDSSLVHATPAESAVVRARTTEVANLGPAVTDEAYRVYLLRRPAQRPIGATP